MPFKFNKFKERSEELGPIVGKILGGNSSKYNSEKACNKNLTFFVESNYLEDSYSLQVKSENLVGTPTDLFFPPKTRVLPLQL